VRAVLVGGVVRATTGATVTVYRLGPRAGPAYTVPISRLMTDEQERSPRNTFALTALGPYLARWTASRRAPVRFRRLAVWQRVELSVQAFYWVSNPHAIAENSAGSVLPGKCATVLGRRPADPPNATRDFEQIKRRIAPHNIAVAAAATAQPPALASAIARRFCGLPHALR